MYVEAIEGIGKERGTRSDTFSFCKQNPGFDNPFNLRKTRKRYPLSLKTRNLLFNINFALYICSSIYLNFFFSSSFPCFNHVKFCRADIYIVSLLVVLFFRQNSENTSSSIDAFNREDAFRDAEGVAKHPLLSADQHVAMHPHALTRRKGVEKGGKRGQQ